jgi:AcrR family transcriptional regulator
VHHNGYVASVQMANSISRRAIPAQARSTATVEKILAAAANILAHEGLPALNTNAVAARAGINVATVYHYFPDKVAILAELFRRDLATRHQYLITRLEEMPSLADMTGWGVDVIGSLLQLRIQDPATAVLRRACRTVPQLLELEEQENDRIADVFAKLLRRRMRHLSPNRARNCARVILETANTLLDRANADVEHSAGLVKETVSMLALYFRALEAES